MSPSFLSRLLRYRDAQNVEGQSYGLTCLMPIAPGRAPWLASRLDSMASEVAESPFGRIDGVHFARLHILHQPVYQGPPQKPDTLKNSYLIFTSAIDGELDRYLEQICARMPGEAEEIFGNCHGYPGVADPERFKAWVRETQVHNGLVVSPYTHSATVADVREALALRADVAGFAARAQSMDPRRLHDAFLAELG